MPALRCPEGAAPKTSIEPAVGSRGRSYDNARTEPVNGLYKTELIRRRCSWQNIDAVESATLDWADLFSHRQLLESIGNLQPAEVKAAYYSQFDGSAAAA